MTSSLLDNVLSNVDEALACQGKLDSWLAQELKTFKRVKEMWLRVRLSDGQYHYFFAVRVKHRNPYSTGLRPYGGGVRYHPGVTTEQMKGLAFGMTLKEAVVKLPFGGAKGGIAFDPKEYSFADIKTITEEFVDELGDSIGPLLDRLAPDMGTDARTMAIIANKYISMNQSSHIPHPDAVVTGKPVAHGSDGVKGREFATALGGLYVVEELRKQNLLPQGEITAVVQGFGNAGANFVMLAPSFGIKVVAVSDSVGGVCNTDGLDYTELMRTKYDEGTVRDHVEGEPITNRELLETPCDLLVPAAIQNVITEENSPQISTKAVLELANGPVTPKADDILKENGILCVPDILASSGGVTVSYYEWLQNTRTQRFMLDDIKKRLSRRMRDNTISVINAASRYDTTLRLGAYHLAIERLFAAFKGKHEGEWSNGGETENFFEGE